MKKRCFVIQRFDGERYDKLYEQVFRPAIERADFEPYRVDRDPSASIPIEAIEKEISSADACFAELTLDAPNIWFELGYSIARSKPLCLICSDLREKFPFDVQHRQIIRYPQHALPRDFIELGDRISDRLTSVAKSVVTLQQNTGLAKALSKSSSLSGLNPHELTALTIIFQSDLTGEATGWSLTKEMERTGFTAFESALALKGLRRKSMVEDAQAEDFHGNRYSIYKVTGEGEDWLMDHQDELKSPVQERSKYPDGITDDDIPF